MQKHSCGTKCNHSKEMVEKAKTAFDTAERVNVESLWAELAEFMLPTHNSQFNGSVTKAARQGERVFDSTAIMAARDLASAIHATITNPAMKWSHLRFTEDALNNNHDGVAWLDQVTELVYYNLSNSNFDLQAGQAYLSLVALATAVIYHEEVDDSSSTYNFANWHLSEVAYAENKYGVVDYICRKFKMTYKQLIEKFPDSCPQYVYEKAECNPLEEEEVWHVIGPRDPAEVKTGDIGKSLPNERPFYSCYLIAKEDHVLGEDGFYEFPVYCPRWAKLPGEVYGYGCGHVSRGDVRTLCKLREEKLRAMAKAVNPPMLARRNSISTADLRPGKITFVDDMEHLKEFVTQTRFDALQLETQELTASIKSAFYIDKLMLPPRTETGEMTAYEISQRLEQMQTILGPALNRLNTEFLQPMILRCVKILLRRNELPPLPESVVSLMQQLGKDPRNIDVEINFVNSLSRSQQLGELRNIQSFVQETFQMAQAHPEVLDKLDFDELVNYAARIRSIPESLILPDEKVAQIRQDRQKQMQQQQQLANAEQLGGVVKNVGSVMPKGGAPQ